VSTLPQGVVKYVRSLKFNLREGPGWKFFYAT
jgi:hypothetical protein